MSSPPRPPVNPSSSTPLVGGGVENVLFFDENRTHAGYGNRAYSFVLRNLCLLSLLCVAIVLLVVFHPEKALDFLGFPRCVQIFSNVARPYWQCRGEDHPQRRHY